MSGFFLITRGITKHALFKRKPDRLAVWMWLLDNVAFKDTTQDAKGKTIPVPRGSVCASLRHIADETGVGHQVVRTALKRFETEHMVNTKVTHGKTVISLCNYEKHQRSDDAPNTAPNTTLTQGQHKPNTQKKQGNKVTRVTNVTQDARAVEILAATVPQQIAQDFVEHRRELKKPLSERAATAMLKKLGGHHDPGAVLTDSIANGWQGIFPEKTKPQFKSITGGHNGQPTNNATDRVQRIVTAAARGTSGQDWG